MKIFSCPMSRRGFLTSAAAAASCPTLLAAMDAPYNLHEAKFYEKLEEKKVKCGLCPRRCITEPGKRGHCGVRENKGGTYFSLVYGRPVARNNDPIEKKPLFHVYPGSRSYSIATVGCNMNCKFCQNHDISQSKPEEIKASYVSPQKIAEAAARSKCKTIAYTYNEPTIFSEYMIDCAKEAKKLGVGNVMISNGYIEEKAQKEVLKHMTAIKVDFKAFSQQFYSKVCEAKLNPVLDSMKRIAKSDVWLEIVVLVVPTLNDSSDEFKKMCAWIVKELGTDIPLHFSRFHPRYKLMNLPQTPTKTLQRARDIAKEAGINYVYTGNVPGTRDENTYCTKCDTMVIKRYGHMTISDKPPTGKCPKCGTKVPGIFESKEHRDKS